MGSNYAGVDWAAEKLDVIVRHAEIAHHPRMNCR